MSIAHLFNFAYTFMLGISPINQDLLVHQINFGSQNIQIENTIFTNLNFKVDIWRFYLGGGVETTIKPIELFNYYPIQDFYGLDAGFKVLNKNNLYTDIYYHRECRHIVAACTMILFKREDYAIDEFYLRFYYNYINKKINITSMIGLGYMLQTHSLRDSLKYIYAYDKNNNFSFITNLKFKYRKVYFKLENKDMIGLDYSLSEELGIDFNVNKNFNFVIGFNNVNRKYKTIINLDGDTQFKDRNKLSIFLKVYN